MQRELVSDRTTSTRCNAVGVSHTKLQLQRRSHNSKYTKADRDCHWEVRSRTYGWAGRVRDNPRYALAAPQLKTTKQTAEGNLEQNVPK